MQGEEAVKHLIGERIREFAEVKYKSLKELAKALGMMPQTLNQYLNGKAVPGGQLLKKFAELGADITYLLTGEKLKEKITKQTYAELTTNAAGYDYPMVSTLSPGSMINFLNDGISEKISFTYHKKFGCIALRFTGDSMMPTIENGDVLLVDSDAQIYDGCVVAAKLKNGKQVVMRYRLLPHELIQLNCDNLHYNPIIVKKEEIELIMPVVKIQRDTYRAE
jgi:SOS-response transcriptional repressor LexA